jgi:two-component system CheB/CheR fusion protein
VDFLEKPVRPEELLASLKRALDQTRDSGNCLHRGMRPRHRLQPDDAPASDSGARPAGHPSKNIAADLGISQRTVDNHRAAIMKKTGSKSMPALIRTALAAA